MRTWLASLCGIAILLLPGLAQSQIAFRAASSGLNEGMTVQHSALGAVASGTGATVTPALPARVPGDLLLTVIMARDDNAISMPSPNWTLLTSSSTGTAHQMAIFWRIATNTAADNAPISHAAGGRDVLIARVVAFSNVDAANPFDGAVSLGTSATNTVATGAVTTANDCSLRVATVHIADNNSITTPPAGFFQSFFSTTGTGADAAIGLWYRNSTGAGVQPSVSIVHSAADPAYAAQFALRPGGLTLNVPGGTQAGDVMVATIATRPANSNPANQNAKTICEPAGWALVRDTTNNNGGGTGGTGMRLQTYVRVATASEPASYTWYAQLNNPSVAPATVFVSGAGGIASYAGVDNATPVDVESGNVTASSLNHTGNSITTTVANTMLVASHSYLSADTWTAAGIMSERVDQSAPASPPGNAVGITLLMSDEPRPAAGATGNRTASGGGLAAADQGIVHMMALRPAPPANPGGFNAFDTTTAAGAITGFIRTRVGGVAVSLDIVALDPPRTAVLTTFTGTVRVEVLNSGDNTGALDAITGCRSSWTTIQTLSPDIVFVSGDLGRKTINFTVPNVYRDARIRVTFPVASPTTTGCSTDNFAVRPSAFSVAVTDATWTTAGTGRTLNATTAAANPVHKAGRNFTLTVTPAPVTATNYDGDATVSALVCTLPATCANGTLTPGTFSGTGARASTTATYGEAGAFNLTMIDQTFANVDSADGTPADCSAAGRYICQSAAPLAVGRFVPDHFAITAVTAPEFRTFDVLNAACSGARSFTYVGQPFGYTTGNVPQASVEARNAAGGATSNYRGALWKLTAASVSQTFANSPVMGVSHTPGTPTLTEIANSGTGTFTADAAAKVSFDRTLPIAPFNANLSLSLAASDATEADGTITTTTPLAFNSIAFDSGNAFRYGRLRLVNANGSQLSPLPVVMEAQYAAFTNPPINTFLGFVTNTADNCTAIANNNVAMAFAGNLAACETAVSGAGTLSAGRRTLLLPAPGNGNDGGAVLTANLGTAASGTTCTVVGGGTVAAAGASRLYLQGNWAGAAYDDNPFARATFGTYKGAGEVIFIRENF